MKQRGAALLVASAVSMASLVVAAPAFSHPCLVPGEQRTIEVRFKVLDKVVKRGDVVRIEVQTYRPAQDDFLGIEEADLPSQTPKERTGEMMLTVGALTGDERVAQNIASKTDDEGHRIVKIRLKPYHYTGPAEVRVRAYVDYLSEKPGGICVEAQEGGFREMENAFTVR